MTSETQRPPMPNEIDPSTVSAIAAGSASELIHPDFAAQDQLDNLLSSVDLPQGVVSISDAPSRRSPIEADRPLSPIEAGTEANDSDPTPNGLKRKEVITAPTTKLGRLASLAMYGRFGGTRSHYETEETASKRVSRESLQDRRQGVIDRARSLSDPVADAESKKSVAQNELDKLFK